MEVAAQADDGAAMAEDDADTGEVADTGVEATAVPGWFPQDIYLPANYTSAWSL